MSSVWNFCLRSSGVISRETVDVLVKCRLFSQAALAENCVLLKLKLAQDHARARRGRGFEVAFSRQYFLVGPLPLFSGHCQKDF